MPEIKTAILRDEIHLLMYDLMLRMYGANFSGISVFDDGSMGFKWIVSPDRPEFAHFAHRMIDVYKLEESGVTGVSLLWKNLQDDTGRFSTMCTVRYLVEVES